MKVQLVLAPKLSVGHTGGVEYLYPPLGILYIASYLRERMPGVEIKITDGFRLGYARMLDEIKGFGPDVLGVSSTTPAAGGAYKLINEIKQISPEMMVVYGGPHPTAVPDDALERSVADYVVRGEGEVVFHNLLNSSDPRTVNGIVYRDNGRIVHNPPQALIDNLDGIPFPARDLIDVTKYPGYYVTKKRPESDIMSTRGCPYNCVFCSNPVWKLSKPWIRLRTPSNVADEIELLKRQFGVREYYDQCDEFNASKDWAMAMCDELIGRKLDTAWKAQVRVDNLNEALVAKMAQAGCWLVFIGIESGNQETLEGIKKHVTLEQVRDAARLFKRYGIKVFGLFMAFNAWEDNGRLMYEDMAKTTNTLDFAAKLVDDGLLDYLTWSLTTPYPGSELYDIATRHNLISEEYRGQWDKIEPIWNFTMQLPGVSDEDWRTIKSRGARLQARCVLRGGRINVSTAKLIMQRGMSMVALDAERTLKKLRLRD